MIRLKNIKSPWQLSLLHRSYKSAADGNYGRKQLVARSKTLTQEYPGEACLNQLNLQRIVQVYRDHGYQHAKIDPLGMREVSDIIESYQLTCGCESLLVSCEHSHVEGVLNMGARKEECNGILQYLKGKYYGPSTFDGIHQYLGAAYCGPVTYEVGYVNEEEKDWFYNVAETSPYYIADDQKRKDICSHLLKSQIMENFLAKKFPTLKRYSGEGAESMLAFFHELFSSSAQGGVEDLLISIPHRGRTSLLTGMLNYPPSTLFHKIKGNAEFGEKYKFVGDVISHLTSSTDLHYGENSIHVTMVPNPSHLEASHPVVNGKARGRQRSKGYGYYGDDVAGINKVINVQVHGDAAITGQGIVMETFALESLPHFDVGGTIHLIVNNQLGFTTPYEIATSSAHCSDIGKLTGCPVIHVNGDYPEEVAKSAQIALDYKKCFHKDIIVNMHCFRRWGHNELDDPTFTNPSMYKIINERTSVPDVYREQLVNKNILIESEVTLLENDYVKFLNDEFKNSDLFVVAWEPFQGSWEGFLQADANTISRWNTGCSIDMLKLVASKSVYVPEHVNIHPHLTKTFCQPRLSKLNDGQNIDWATAEAMAIGSLLLEGHHVRICGQDVGRATFNHRHAMLVDQETDGIYIPLNAISQDQKGFLEVANSLLSEEAVLAYEYGMSIESPNNLMIWEAQFGDFFNGAQIIIDTFVANGELKWLLQSGLVLLLPHGMDGAGPDHSSCKIERFLQLCDSKEDGVDGDDVNMQIVNPTTPAQYFHLLRRQLIRNYRKPLIVASPKLILRMKAASSSLCEMAKGRYFNPVIGDVERLTKVNTVLFCSGKHYYKLEGQRRQHARDDMAIIRLESLVPFPAEELKEELRRYTDASEFIWCQEEHRNQGAWTFVYPRFMNLLNIKLTYAGRAVLGTSATGVGKWHGKEVDDLGQQVFGKK